MDHWLLKINLHTDKIEVITMQHFWDWPLINLHIKHGFSGRRCFVSSSQHFSIEKGYEVDFIEIKLKLT